MLKPKNKRIQLKESQTKLFLSTQKNEPTQKRNIFGQSEMKDASQYSESQMLKQKQEQAWQNYEIITTRSLQKEDRKKREKLLQYLLFSIQPLFNLKLRTIQHTIKMLDILQSRRLSHPGRCSKSSTKKVPIYPDNKKLLLDMITCLFLSCKFNQIYPPGINQLSRAMIYSSDENYAFDNGRIMQNEIEIIETLGFDLVVALVSDWYKMINGHILPTWAYLCYLEYNLNDKSKNIAEDIISFENYTLNSAFRDKYLQFFHSTSKRQLSAEDSIGVYLLFVEFRVKKQVSKLTPYSQLKINQNNVVQTKPKRL